MITEDCVNLARTLPKLIHDEKNIEDVDDRGETHSYDSARYGLMAAPTKMHRHRRGPVQAGAYFR